MSDSMDYERPANASSTSSTRTPPNCARCRNHRKKIVLKGHKRYCMYRSCKCEKCRLTTQRQKIMAMQTALKRAQVQDEAMLRNGIGTPDLPLISLPQNSPSPIHATERSLDCDSSASSQYSNPPSVVRRTPTIAAPSSTNILTNLGECPSYSSDYKVHQKTDLLEDCQRLLDKFKYPWEMMPLMYAILKDANADLDEASRRIDEDSKMQDRRPYNNSTFNSVNLQFKCKVVI